MADGVPVTAGSGTSISTDDRGADGHVQRVSDVSSSDFANGRVGPTTTAATLLAARANRKLVTFINVGTVTVYIGKATVTSTNGVPLLPGDSIDWHSTALVQAVAASGTGDIAYVEYFDA